MKKLLICLALLLISQDLFAESNIFTIPQSDLSMKLLNHVFGTVGTIVTGFVSQTALTNVLKYFNNACLVLGGILILYSLIVSTINTAHDGEMLGKKWNSVWIPIRAALGFGLLLPTKATLVVIQVFVIWVVVQGVGAADYLWQNTIEQPENYMPPPQLASPMDYQSVLSAASLTFVNQVTQNLTAQLASTNTEPVTPKNTDTGSAIQLGISSIPNNPALCGSVGYETVNHSATQTFVDNIASSATNDFLSDYDANNPQALTTSQISSIQNSLVAASKAYISAAMQTQEQFQQQGALHADYSVDNNTLKNMIENGWISAGSYYMMISKSSQMQTYVTISPPSITQPDATSIQSVLGQQNAEEVQFAVRTAVRASCLSATAGQCVTPADAGATTQLQIERPTGLIQKILMVINPAYDFLQAVLAGLTAILNSAGIGNLSHMGDVTSGYNPITSIMGWGQSILTGLANVTIVMMAVMFSVGLASYTCSCVNPAGYALSSALTWFLPFIFMIMLAAWLFGSLAAFYVPLIPYILFTLGAVSWIIAVIEAMVAAPLMALGILHPEGRHDIFGHASAGIMILANVFLRPSLMIVGFWGGYILLGIVCGILNTGFTYMVGSLNNNTITPYGAVSFMGIYILILLILINKAFSLIYVIPDRIFRWIGGPSEDTGMAQELGQIKQGVESQARKASDTGRQAQTGQKELAQQRQNKSKADKSDGGSEASGGGQG